MMKNTEMNTAWAEVRASADTKVPMPSVARMKGSVAGGEQQHVAARPVAEDQARADHADRQRDVARDHARQQLAEDDLQRRRRLREHLLVGAVLALRHEPEARLREADVGQEQARECRQVEVQVAQRGVVAELLAQLDRRRASRTAGRRLADARAVVRRGLSPWKRAAICVT